MFDIKKIVEEAQEEVNEERAKKAKTLIKEKLAQIDKAKKVVVALEIEYAALLKEIGSTV